MRVKDSIYRLRQNPVERQSQLAPLQECLRGKEKHGETCHPVGRAGKRAHPQQLIHHQRHRIQKEFRGDLLLLGLHIVDEIAKVGQRSPNLGKPAICDWNVALLGFVRDSVGQTQSP